MGLPPRGPGTGAVATRTKRGCSIRRLMGALGRCCPACASGGVAVLGGISQLCLAGPPGGPVRSIAGAAEAQPCRICGVSVMGAPPALGCASCGAGASLAGCEVIGTLTTRPPDLCMAACGARAMVVAGISQVLTLVSCIAARITSGETRVALLCICCRLRSSAWAGDGGPC